MAKDAEPTPIVPELTFTDRHLGNLGRYTETLLQDVRKIGIPLKVISIVRNMRFEKHWN